MGKNKSHVAKVVIVNAEKSSGTALYRAHAAERCLEKLGLDVDIHDTDSLDTVSVENVVACLFVRTPLSNDVAAFIERLKLAGVIVIADFDDLIFRPELLHLIDGVKYLTDVERQHFFERTFLYQNMVKMADRVIGTTLPLAAELKRYNNNVSVIRNYPLSITKNILINPDDALNTNGKFVIGYYSGTLTHQADFRQCAGALAKLLRQRHDVELRVVGKLNINEFVDFEGIESRIVQLSVMPYEKMLLDLANCHVNIAPLELGNVFCECKSELKYFDAALMCVPTIASPTMPFQAVIRHGINGFLAGTMDEWTSSFATLLRDKDVAKNVGANARRYALSYFGEAAQLNDYRNLMKSMLTSDTYERV